MNVQFNVWDSEGRNWTHLQLPAILRSAHMHVCASPYPIFSWPNLMDLAPNPRGTPVGDQGEKGKPSLQCSWHCKRLHEHHLIMLGI
jgi:hypothetical protein